MGKRILLVNPYPHYAHGVEGTKYPPLGLLYIASFLRQKGFGQVRVYDANIAEDHNEAVLEKIRVYKPDIVGVSANIVTHRAALELARLVKEAIPEVIVVAGGAFPSLFPEKYLAWADYVVEGEGEEVFFQLVQKIDQGLPVDALPALIWRSGARIARNPRQSAGLVIDSLPLPAYDLLEPALSEYSHKGRVVKKFMAPLLTSRGCPYQCTYCNKSVFGSKFRARSPQSIIDEIEFLHKNFSVRQIDILDDNFNLIPERAVSVMDMIIARNFGLAINCHNGLRADKLNGELAKRLKAAGVFKVGLGVESADEQVRTHIKKDLDIRAVTAAVEHLRKVGIVVHAYFILGLPGDTPASMQRTIDFAKSLNPHFINPATCVPFPGTELYEEVKKNGTLLVDVEDGVESGFFDGKVFFELGQTRRGDVALYFKKAFRDFYGRPSKIWDILTHLHSLQDLAWVIAMGCSVIVNIIKKKRYATA